MDAPIFLFGSCPLRADDLAPMVQTREVGCDVAVGFVKLVKNDGAGIGVEVLWDSEMATVPNVA